MNKIYTARQGSLVRHMTLPTVFLLALDHRAITPQARETRDDACMGSIQVLTANANGKPPTASAHRCDRPSNCQHDP